ncbi:MAG: CotH kinase family protein, partial [Brumimicrobium sp.]
MKKLLLNSLLLFSLIILKDENLLGQQLVINEVVASNLHSLLDDTENNSDWIELFNNSDNEIYLGNYFLSDDSNNHKKWRLPEVYISPNSHLIIYASGNDDVPSFYHTNFKLAAEGESVILSNQYGQPIDQVNLPELYRDISYGRSEDGVDNWGYFDTPTPSETNNNVTNYPCLLKEPTVNIPSSNQAGQVVLSTQHNDPEVDIYYTTNGNDPTFSDQVYDSPVNLTNGPAVNNYSSISTNPSLNFPLPGYNETRANNRGWVPPYSPVNTVNVIKFQARKEGCVSSDVVARTYLIDQDHDLHVLSIQTDSSGFFSDENGIYVWGDDEKGNYNREGFSSERRSFVDFFNPDGNLVFSEQVGLRIGGGGSRHSTQKNLNVFIRGVYGNPYIENKIFQDSYIDRWKRLTFRSGGHRPDCLPKDEFASALVDKLPVTHSKYHYASTYLNGEYWGIQAVKERMNSHYLAERYGLTKDSIVFLGSYGRVLDGTEQDSIEYAELMDFARNNDLNITQNYDSIKSQIDIENYKDYYISEIFLGNADWPNSNIKFWKKRNKTSGQSNIGHDGKWRWVLFDLDGSFGGTCNDVYVTFNTLNWALQDDGSFDKYTVLFRNLIENEQFKTDFINRTCDLVNSSFKYEITGPKLQNIKNTIDLEIDNHINRWRYPSTSNTLTNRYSEVPNTDQWEYLTAQMDTFLMQRPHYVRKHMYDEWGLSDSVRLSVNVDNQNMGKVKVSSILIDEYLEGVPSNIYPWMGVYFSAIDIPLEAVPKKGYRFVEWIETGVTDARIVVTLSSDSLFTARFEPDPNYEELEPVVINEIQSSNQNTFSDKADEFDDWIELYNPNKKAVNLKGYYLTNDPSNPTKYLIDNDIFIYAEDHLIFWCDNQNEQGLTHTKFTLNKDGDFIGLVDPNKTDYIDSLSFDHIKQGYSYGRAQDGALEWIIFEIPTPDAPNEIISTTPVDNNLVVYPNPNNQGILNFSMPIS